MTTAFFYVIESGKSVIEYPETMRNVKQMMIEEMRRGAAQHGLDVNTQRDLRWLPPQFLILLFKEDSDGNGSIHRIVATSVEEATHVRMTCEALFDPVGF